MFLTDNEKEYLFSLCILFVSEKVEVEYHYELFTNNRIYTNNADPVSHPPLRLVLNSSFSSGLFVKSLCVTVDRLGHNLSVPIIFESTHVEADEEY